MPTVAAQTRLYSTQPSQSLWPMSPENHPVSPAGAVCLSVCPSDAADGGANTMSNSSKKNRGGDKRKKIKQFKIKKKHIDTAALAFTSALPLAHFFVAPRGGHLRSVTQRPALIIRDRFLINFIMLRPLGAFAKSWGTSRSGLWHVTHDSGTIHDFSLHTVCLYNPSRYGPRVFYRLMPLVAVAKEATGDPWQDSMLHAWLAW
ncbi:uncharacterized protein L203_103222 [Cryptococcus depauperatus CBS 7841]|uniref:Uncharacterized protein n=1 Tax=Cryptococcus depauperatus CBS 7841 TaxID=1295531 RepID=A0AAJ8JT56_9TREE